MPSKVAFAALLSVFVLFSCSTMRQVRWVARRIAHSEVFARGMTGFVLWDAQSGRPLVEVCGNRHFTPASNTKVLTLAACLQLLPDTLPAVEVRQLRLPDNTDTPYLLLRGIGNPTFLHPNFAAWQSAFAYLRQRDGSVWIYPGPGYLKRFGPGWAWDDYAEDFQPERSALPIYGHVVRVRQRPNEPLEVWPLRFRDSCRLESTVLQPQRDEWRNRWTLPQSSASEERDLWLPFVPSCLPELLSDTLNKVVTWLPSAFAAEATDSGWVALGATPLDTVLRRMMHQSDNFIAEQLLLMCARQRFGTFEAEAVISWMLDSVWTAIPERPRWVDGSGLSRYNLISPRAMAYVLWLLWHQQPRARLLNLFPAGGRDGTIARWYAPSPGETPWIFAKTGTLSGVHCLSGYLIARSGRVLIFSFMHTNFIGSSTPWKSEMERLLRQICQRY